MTTYLTLLAILSLVLSPVLIPLGVTAVHAVRDRRSRRRLTADARRTAGLRLVAEYE